MIVLLFGEKRSLNKYLSIAWMYNIYVCMHMHMNICVNIHMYIYIYIHVYICMCINITFTVCVCMYVFLFFSSLPSNIAGDWDKDISLKSNERISVFDIRSQGDQNSTSPHCSPHSLWPLQKKKKKYFQKMEVPPTWVWTSTEILCTSFEVNKKLQLSPF